MKPKPQNGEAEKLPHNLEAERSVLGAILLDNHCLPITMEHLIPEDFFLPQHIHTYGAMVELYQASGPIDVITLMDALDKAGDLEAAGGIAYLSQLADGLPRASHVEHHAKIVKEKAVLRSIAHLTQAIHEQSMSADDDSDAILNRAKESLNKLAELKPKAGLIGIQDIANQNYSRLEKIFSGDRSLTGLPTGYDGIDTMMAGLQPSELIILAARPSMGKTSLALNIVENVAARRKQPVAMFSLEMSKESLLLRLLASVAQVDAHKFRTGMISGPESERITLALSRLAEAPIWIDDSSTSTINDIGARAERLKREHGLSLGIVDYIQLIAPVKGSKSRQEEVSAISRGLKALSKDLGIPIIALSQLSRSNEMAKRRPQLSDLRESGAIEQDADVVLFIDRPNIYKADATDEDRGKAELIIAKQRNGPVATVNFVFLARHTRFEEAAPDAWGSGLGETEK